MERRKKSIKKRVVKFIKWGFIGLLVLGWLFITIVWAQLREVPSIHDPQTIVFETGTGSIVQFIVMMLLGLLMLLVGGFLSWAVAAEFVTERQKLRDRLKNFGLALLFLVIFAMGAGILYYEIWEDARSERVVIDKTSETIKVEKSYLLRDETELWVAFEDIRHIEYYYERGSPGVGASCGAVNVIKRDGTTIRISDNGPQPQYNLAKAIAEATRKPLIEKK